LRRARRIARPERRGRIARVLQGGGALGACQAGVYQALQEAGLEPDWVSGVSIGAINGAT
jgi:NTE family protein